MTKLITNLMASCFIGFVVAGTSNYLWYRFLSTRYEFMPSSVHLLVWFLVSGFVWLWLSYKK